MFKRIPTPVVGLAVGAIAASALLTVGAIAGQAPAGKGQIEWKLGEGGPRTDGKVQFGVTWRSGSSLSSTSEPIALTELQGLSPAQVASQDGGPVRFRLVREAGAFECEGSVRKGRGLGDCAFRPDETFAGALERRGVGRPTGRQQFDLAMANVGIAYLDEVERQKYERPDVDDLVMAAHHGADLEYLKAMDAAGQRFGELSDLVRMRDHDVSPEFIRALAAEGLGTMPADELQRLRDHDVSPTYIRELRSLGYGDLTAEELVRLRDHAVSVAYVRELKGLGYDDLSADDLVRLRDHGVSVEFVRRANLAGDRLPASTLIRMRNEG